ncbi:MAG TPA: SMP-30/gluconolactonase/LRE family protein, partial [Albitalea sp.]|nr:SMP-30/gluconolactonase/LRE family protein [Albitalea sp.]
MRAQLQVDARNALGEGVLWCERTQRVFWTDIMASTLWCHHPATGTTRQWALPERLGSFAFTPDENRLLLGLAKQLAFFDLASGELDTVCRVEPELPTTRVNDGRCDRQGRFVFGTMNEAPDLAPLGSFYRLN